jgi:large subunit ribosomal protein L6
MSRIGSQNIDVKDSLSVTVKGADITIKGSNGELSHTCPKLISVSYDAAEKQIVVARENDTRQAKALHGLTRSLINNIVIGVDTGWKKELEIRGTGYRGQIQGQKLNLSLGHSHPIEYAVPAGVKVTMPENTKVIIEGADKQAVGQVAADIRAYRKPEVYKGKGVRYVDEVVILKEGKSAGK